MESVLIQLFQGKLQPYKTMTPKSGEYAEFLAEFEMVCENFSQKLENISPELAQTFSSLIDSVNILRCLEAEELFAQSFGLGVKLLGEALSVS